MNYHGNEELRADVGALTSDMYEMLQLLRELERRYFWKSEDLTERLAGQLINQVSTQFQGLYSMVDEMQRAFRD